MTSAITAGQKDGRGENEEMKDEEEEEEEEESCPNICDLSRKVAKQLQCFENSSRSKNHKAFANI